MIKRKKDSKYDHVTTQSFHFFRPVVKNKPTLITPELHYWSPLLSFKGLLNLRRFESASFGPYPKFLEWIWVSATVTFCFFLGFDIYGKIY